MDVVTNQINLKGEDFHFDFILNDNIQVVGVADGHGGKGAASLCTKNIENTLKTVIQDNDDFEKCCQILFSTLHEQCKPLQCYSGCTLTVVLINLTTNVYTCANVGDSMAIHIKPYSYMWITTSHRLQDSVTERNRLKNNVSYIMRDNVAFGPPRLFPGGLSCSRSIGDYDCEFICSSPSLYSDTLHYDDMILICTDGVWDTIDTNKIIKVIRTSLSSDALCKILVKKYIQDDVTATLICKPKKRARSGGMFKLFTKNTSNSSLSSMGTPSP